MKKLILILVLFPFILNAQQSQESINYWENKPIKYKTAGTQLKAAGTAFYFSTAFAAAGFLVSYVGTNSLIKEYSLPKYYDTNNLILYNYDLTEDDIDDITARTKRITTISTIAYGASSLSALIAFGKLISAGNLLEAERRQANKNTSLNFTGNGVSLVYKF